MVYRDDGSSQCQLRTGKQCDIDAEQSSGKDGEQAQFSFDLMKFYAAFVSTTLCVQACRSRMNILGLQFVLFGLDMEFAMLIFFF